MPKMQRQVQSSLKIVTSLLLALILMIQVSVVPTSAAAAKVKVTSAKSQLVFDGKTLVIPEGQYIFAIKGTNYVPLRFFSYALQKSVKWDSKNASVFIGDPSKQEAVQLNERLLNMTGKDGQVSSKGGEKITVSPVDAKFIFDGKEQVLPEGQTAYALNGTIYVPIRFMSQSVGTTIKWEKTGKITGESVAYKAQQNGTKPNTGSGSNTGTGTGTGNGGTSSGPSTPSYESITSATEERLYTLRASCEEQLKVPAVKWLLSDDSAVKDQAIGEANSIVADCTVKFEEIVNNAEKQLIAGNYSTAIIADYRKAFKDEMEAGKQLLKGMI